ncbi:hypothetical protein LTR37_013469 [Vermiconidia calcicola]|uniref:Uncharacterized protein n=1 Tax=Vermiconidia calcicola TaxID=1690605 RepID=A0ACC3MWF0_9PEZI|nr:hypothetical protein LTR37_013469 [Vermiconidia calcicola]
MKFNIALPLLAALASAENAKVLLEPLEFENVRIEKSYEVEWSADRRVTLQLVLVKQTQDGWRKVKTLFEDRKGDAPGGSFTWDVDESYPACSGYALWLSSENRPDDSTGYADLTDWFDIKGHGDGL